MTKIYMGKANNLTILLELTIYIVNSRVSNNGVMTDSLPNFVKNLHASLSTATEEMQIYLASPRLPAVPIASSISNDFLICLEDG